MRRAAAILRLIRFPLVWTALADSLAGAAIAAAGAGEFSLSQVAPLLLITPGLYLFGMGINDLMDVRDDSRAGRDRPLARGQLRATSATSVVVVLLGVVLSGTAYGNIATQKMVAMTLGLITVYNLLAKRWLPTAIIVMSLCRVGNVLVGWSLVTNNWRFDLQERGGYAWGLVISVAALTAVASIVSGLEKRYGLRTVAGRPPSAIILGALLLLPVADCANVMIAWRGAPEALLWLAAVPLVLGSAALVRRLARPARAETQGNGDA